MPLPSRDVFTTISQIYFDHSRCIGCELCRYSCPVEDLIDFDFEHSPYITIDRKCRRCEECVGACPMGAVRLVTVRDPTDFDFTKPRFLAPGQRVAAKQPVYRPKPPSSPSSSS